MLSINYLNTICEANMHVAKEGKKKCKTHVNAKKQCIYIDREKDRSIVLKSYKISQRKTNRLRRSN